MLETVARIPYFAFISMLHLYETLGWWRAAAPLRKVGSVASPLNARVTMLLCAVILGDYMQRDG